MKNIFLYTILVAGSLFTATPPARSQSVLDQPVTVKATSLPLDKILETISRQANFYFSYSSDLIKKDSLVTLNMSSKPVRQVLDTLFRGRLEYKVNGNYIILRKAPPVTTILSNTGSEDKKYVIRGIIRDENTGEGISQASIYDKQGLIATLSNEDGFFTIRLKNRAGPAALTISKEFYDDTTIKIEPGVNQKLTITVTPSSIDKKMITIGPEGYLPSDSIRVELDGAPIYMRKDPIRVEMTGLGRLLLSSRLKMQSINLSKFFIQQPFQLSLIPGIGTQGGLSPQITNKISINLIGGYTAGLNGIELGGVINIDKQKVEGLQAAGIVNVVGGPVKGVQLAGSHNIVLDSVHGLQAAGVGNFNKGKTSGVQLAGVMNKVSNSMDGVQVAGVLNMARRLKGVQIGLVNIADTSEGISIGLLNIVKKGMHEISLFANETTPLNLAYRAGNDKLYSIFLAGFNPDNNRRCYSYGFGLGHRFHLGRTLSLSPELTSEHLAGDEWNNFKYSNILSKFSLDLRVRLGKYISLSGGPSFAVYSFDKALTVRGHDFSPVPDNYGTWRISDKVTGWIGWRIGISFL